MAAMVLTRRFAAIAAAGAIVLTCTGLAVGLLLADGSEPSSSNVSEGGKSAASPGAEPSRGKQPASSPDEDRGGSSSGADQAPSPPARGSAGSATVWAVGDVEASDSGRKVAQLVAGGRPDRFLYLGDVYESGTADDFRDYDSLYRPLRSATAPTPGNHDWPNQDEGYGPYWRRATGRPQPDHYSFRIAGWQFISLNSEAVDSGQMRWLRRRLADGGNCRIAFYHRPRFSAGSHGDQSQVEPFWRALRGRARLVLSAHDHNMQRLRRSGGVTQLVAGAGGHSHYPVDEGDSRLVWANDSDWGAVRLRLRPGRADFAFVGIDGRVLHQGSTGCTS
jgi:hypothetical protein